MNKRCSHYFITKLHYNKIFQIFSIIEKKKQKKRQHIIGINKNI